MELKRYKLSEVAKVEISSVDKKTKENETPVRLCNFTDVYHNWAITSDMASSFMEASANSSEIEKFTIKKGQVAFTKDSETRDDIGIPTYIADDFEDVILGYHCALITPDETKLCGKYLNAFMHSAYIQRYFELNATGSGMRYTLSLDTLESMPLLLPSLEEQRRIGEIFSSLDKKISINRAINQNLEALAKQLYDYWFVQFDFPNEEGKPYKSSGGKMVWNEKIKREIPVKWEVKSLSSVAIVNQKSLSKEDILTEIEYLDTSSLTENNITETQQIFKEEAPSRAQRKVKQRTILYSTVRPRLKHYGILCNPASNLIVSTGFATIDALDIRLAYYIYYVLTQKSITEYLGSIADTAVSSYPSINPTDLESINVVIPDERLIKAFDETISPLYELKEDSAKTIQTLIKQRDELLPLLMNGQVSLNSDLSAY